MKNKKIMIQFMAKEHNYSIIKEYVNHDQKIKLSCKKCSTERELLPKSFIRTPSCKTCRKNDLLKKKEKEKITQMNIKLRRRAKKIGFKINTWYEELPSNVKIQCRECDATYERAINSIRNGLTCFSCRKRHDISAPNKLMLDFPLLVDSIYKNIELESNEEKSLANELASFFRIYNINKLSFNKENETFYNKNTTLSIRDKSYNKKFLLTNSFQKDEILLKNVFHKNLSSINNIDESYGIDIFYKEMYDLYQTKLFSFSKEKRIKFVKKILFHQYYLIYNKENNNFDFLDTSLINNIEDVDIRIVNNSLTIHLNNNFILKLKIQTAVKRDKISSIDNLFQENWTLSSS